MKKGPLISPKQLNLRVCAVLERIQLTGVRVELRSFQSPARRASQAAKLLDCSLGAVVKSLVFESCADQSPLLVLVSGQNRADQQILSRCFGRPVRPASPARVEEISGFCVGAVPPFGLKTRMPVIMDADLMAFDQVWASAGAIHVLMRMPPKILAQWAGGRIEKICLADRKRK